MRAVFGRTIVVGTVLLFSCVVGGEEQAGDIAYREGRFAEALGSYRRAGERNHDPGVLAKLGAAALRAGELREAIEAYLALAARAPQAREEAWYGIELAARKALEADDAETVREAVLALQTVAPERPIGRYALSLVRAHALAPDEEVRFIPAALGAATDRPEADTLLREYARDLRTTVSCDRAISAYRSLRRRTEENDPSLARGAAAEYAACALQLGLAEVQATPWTAEEYFREAIAADSTSATGRRSLVGFGDARVAQGDMFGGAMAYQAALDLAADTDSIVDLAAARLNGIANAVSADDTTGVVP